MILDELCNSGKIINLKMICCRKIISAVVKSTTNFKIKKSPHFEIFEVGEVLLSLCPDWDRGNTHAVAVVIGKARGFGPDLAQLGCGRV